MSVIGRLDPQVEDVLISPSARRRRNTTPDATPTNTTPDDRPEAPPRERDERRDEDARAELPVWLL